MTAQNRRYSVLLTGPCYRTTLVEISAPGPAEAAAEAVSRYNSDPDFRDEADQGWEYAESLDPIEVFADWVRDLDTGKVTPAPGPDISAELTEIAKSLSEYSPYSDVGGEYPPTPMEVDELKSLFAKHNLKISKA